MLIIILFFISLGHIIKIN